MKVIRTKIKNADLILEKRKQISKGAIKVFAEKGFHGTTVREIAEASGLTMGSLYNYIRAKEDIIYIIYEYGTGLLRDDIKKAVAKTENPKDQFEAAFRQILKTVHENQAVFMLLYKESTSLDRDHLYSILRKETDYIEMLEQLLRKRFEGKKISEGRLRLAADSLSYLSVIVAFRRWSLKRRFDSMDEVIEGIVAFALYGINHILE